MSRCSRPSTNWSGVGRPTRCPRFVVGSRWTTSRDGRVRQGPGRRSHVAGRGGRHEVRRVARLARGGRLHGWLGDAPSAEPDTLVVRCGLEEREWLLADAPETYYLTDYYRKYPLVLVRLSRVDRDAVHDLLSVSWRMTKAKTRTGRPAASARRTDTD